MTQIANSVDGTRIAYDVKGPATGRPILLIHGWAQARMVWEAQAPLAARHRLIAMDLRGHGDSDCPPEAAAYTQDALWAADVAAVLRSAAAQDAVLVGWSYGARVIAAYLDQFGPDAAAGLVLAGGTLAMGRARETWMVAPDSPGLNRALYDDNDAVRSTATEAFVAACTLAPLEPAFAARLIQANHRVPAFVRRAMFKCDVDARPVWARFHRPALVVHGAQDTIVPPQVGRAAAAALPDATLRLYDTTGHAPFLEQPDAFNADMEGLIARL